MSRPNEHIEKYLDFYLNLKSSPHFAVLLHGDWGCGKTWFIKNYVEKFKETGITALYVTLYGVLTYSDIEDQIFQQLHPILSSKPMKLAGTLLKGMIKGGLKIDLNEDVEASASANPESVKLSSLKLEPDRCFLIFDDIERAHMPLSLLLGYLNSFVEHQGLKVILIGNEHELDKSSLKTRNNKSDQEKSDNLEDYPYRKVKEKLVGKTFRVIHDLESAYDSFLQDLSDSSTKTFLLKMKAQITGMFNRAGYDNLRHLHISFLDFERFFLLFSRWYQKYPELLNDLLPFFFVFSFEIQAGKLLPENIVKIRPKFLASVVLEKEKGKREKSQGTEFVRKYGLNIYDTILSEKCWTSFFDTGFIPESELTESVDKTSYVQNEKTPAWVRLWHYQELEDKEFEESLKQVEEEWATRTFKHPGEILHVCGLLLRFASLKILPKSIEQTVDDCKRYIDDISKTTPWQNMWRKDSELRMLNVTRGFGGLGFAAIEMKEFSEIMDYLFISIERAKTEGMANAGKGLLEVMAKDPFNFSKITIFSNEDPVYYQTPVLANIQPSEFLRVLLSLTNKAKSLIGYALQRRYEYPDIRLKLKSEIPFLKGIRDLLPKEIQKCKGKITGHVLENFIYKPISDAIEKMED